jgi:hypothetical protein
MLISTTFMNPSSLAAGSDPSGFSPAVRHHDEVSTDPLRQKLGEPRLGVDIGRVIIDGPAHPGGGDTAFFEGDEATMLATPEMAGSFAAIARLVGLFAGRVWLVSKCGPRVQERTLRWLAAHDFYRRTGLWRGNVRFCLTHADKRSHCQELGLTHFVDDHPAVHSAIRGLVAHQYFFGTQAQPVPGYGIRATDWAEAEALITASLAATSPLVRLRDGVGPCGPA